MQASNAGVEQGLDDAARRAAGAEDEGALAGRVKGAFLTEGAEKSVAVGVVAG